VKAAKEDEESSKNLVIDGLKEREEDKWNERLGLIVKNIRTCPVGA
jgi:hypothetical protein